MAGEFKTSLPFSYYDVGEDAWSWDYEYGDGWVIKKYVCDYECDICHGDDWYAEDTIKTDEEFLVFLDEQRVKGVEIDGW